MSCAWCASDNGDHIKPFFHFVKLDHKIAHTDILRNVWRLWCQNRPRKGLVCDLRNTININPKQVKTKNVEFSVYRIAHNPQAVETWKRAEEWLPNSLSATFQFSTLSSFRYITTPLTFLGKSRPKWSIRHPSLKKKGPLFACFDVCEIPQVQVLDGTDNIRKPLDGFLHSLET